MKKTTLLLISVILLTILLSSLTTAVLVTDAHGINQSNTGSDTQARGVKIIMNKDATLYYVTTADLSTCPRVRLWNGSYSLLATGSTVASKQSNFTYNLTKGRSYYVDCDNSGGSYTQAYQAGGAPGYPFNRTNLNYTTGVQGGVDVPDNIINIKSITTEEIIIIIPSENSIVFVSQNPTNITSTSIFNGNVNITYNFTTTNLTLPRLNYTVYGRLGCIEIKNGTCLFSNNTYKTTTNASTVVESSNQSRYSFSLEENDIYPHVENLPLSSFNTVHTRYTLSINNDLIGQTFINLSNTGILYNILEIMATSTGTSKVYACNSTYTTGKVDLSSNCQEIGNINNGFNHSHSTNSNHSLVPFSIINGNIGGIGITFTTNMTFFVRGQNGITTNTYYITTPTRTNSLSTSGNLGIGYSYPTGTLDAHIHQYTGNEYLKYTAIGLYNATTILNETFVNELIDVIQLQPSPPTITNPFNTIQNTSTINITWTNATGNYLGSTITKYNITLLNSDFTLNKTITTNAGLNNSYNYNLYDQNLDLGIYYVRVYAYESNGLYSYDEEQFNLTRNAQLNITVSYVYGGLIQNYTLNLTNTNTSLFETYTTTNYNKSIDIIKNNTYTILTEATGYAYLNTTYTSNATSYQNLNIQLYSTNSVLINVFDETTTTNILENVTLVMTGSSIELTYYSTNGTFYITNLNDDTYTTKLSSSNYTLKSYILTVSNRSFQTLNAYLSKSTQSTIFNIVDSNTLLPLENAFTTVEKIINGSYTVIESKYSDLTGRVQIIYTPNVAYRFTISKTGYSSKVFSLDPVLFTEYTIPIDNTGTSNLPSQFGDISVTYYPTSFINNKPNNITITFSSPNGQLINHTVNISYPIGSNQTTMTNAYGNTAFFGFTPVNATIGDKVNFTYNYYSTISGYRTFKLQFEITNTTGSSPYSIVNVAKRDYGLGDFEKIFIIEVATAIFAGFAFMLGGIGFGLFAGLMMMGIGVYLGFMPIWAFLITALAGFILMIRYGGQ